MDEKKTTKPSTGTTAQKKEHKASSAANTANTGNTGKLLAIIMLRGGINARTDILTTMDKLMLRQKLACTVFPYNKPNLVAMQKCKDYTTFGEISEETYKLLVEKRGQKDMNGKLKKYFRLHPPRGGFEKKGIKLPYTLGGALGNRKDKMNDLIRKML